MARQSEPAGRADQRLRRREGLPSPETLGLLQGYNVLRSDGNGGIDLTSDGEQMWVEIGKIFRNR